MKQKCYKTKLFHYICRNKNRISHETVHRGIQQHEGTEQVRQQRGNHPGPDHQYIPVYRRNVLSELLCRVKNSHSKSATSRSGTVAVAIPSVSSWMIRWLGKTGTAPTAGNAILRISASARWKNGSTRKRGGSERERNSNGANN